MSEELEKLRYPIGKYHAPEVIGKEQIEQWISQIQLLPSKMHEAASDLTDEQSDTPYRPGGWTLRQVVHHVPDSHINAYVRFKLALTEANPTIKPYFEDRWAGLEDGKFAPVQVSLNLLDSLHQRWVLCLRGLAEEDWDKTYFHPESGKNSDLRTVLGMYAWHGEHHLHQVLAARNQFGF